MSRTLHHTLPKSHSQAQTQTSYFQLCNTPSPRQNATGHAAEINVPSGWSWVMTIVSQFTGSYSGYVAVDDIVMEGCTSQPTSPPNVYLPPPPIVGNYRDTGSTYCYVTGNPQPKITWLQKNMLIHRDSTRLCAFLFLQFCWI